MLNRPSRLLIKDVGLDDYSRQVRLYSITLWMGGYHEGLSKTCSNPYSRRMNPPAPLPCFPVAQAFADSPLYLGGPVQLELLHVIHGIRGVEDAVPIIDVRLLPLALSLPPSALAPLFRKRFS